MRIIVFGNVPLASWLIERLCTSELELVGVVCDEYDENAFAHHGMNYPSANAMCERLAISKISFDEAHALAQNSEVLGMSVRYHRLFKRQYFESFTPGIINFHGGELPRFRGTNIANHAILQGVERGAGTLHYIDDGVDQGDVVFREFFDVAPEWTAFDYFTQTIEALQIAASKLITVIENDQPIPRVSQEYFIQQLGESAREYKRRELEPLKKVAVADVLNCGVRRKVRAFTFGNHSGAYFEEEGERFLLSKVLP